MNSISYGAAMLLVGVLLAATWVGLVVFKIAGAEDLIALCKYGLTALVTHYLTYADPAASQGSTTITLPKGGQQ